jgi:hypothetical protein
MDLFPSSGVKMESDPYSRPQKGVTDMRIFGIYSATIFLLNFNLMLLTSKRMETHSENDVGTQYKHYLSYLFIYLLYLQYVGLVRKRKRGITQAREMFA